MTMAVTATGFVNRAPTGQDHAVTTAEDTTYTLTPADFPFSDQDNNTLKAVVIVTTPASGSLTLSGTPVSSGTAVSAADLGLGLLRFRPAADASGLPYTSLTFRVVDTGGTANGGEDTDALARTLTVHVTPVNDPPVGQDRAIAAIEDVAYVFTPADFPITDIDGHTLLAVRIGSLPEKGLLTENGAAVQVGQFIPLASITSGGLRYIAAANEHGANYATFTFQVQDNGSTTSGGSDLAVSANIMTINVASVNDAPVGSDRQAMLAQGATKIFSLADFPIGDLDGNQLAAVTITSLPAAGSGALQVSGSPVAIGQVVPAADIAAGNLQFVPVGTFTGNAVFTFRVQDNGGTAGGGVDTAVLANTFVLHYLAGPFINRAPSGSDASIGTFQGHTYVLKTTDFDFSDPDGNALRAVLVTTLPASGVLSDNGSIITAGTLVTVDRITSGLFTYTAPNVPGTTDSFTFQVQDDGGTAGGGVDLDQSPNTITFTIAKASQQPVAQPATVNAFEDQAYVFRLADFAFTDGDTPPDQLAGVIVTTLPSFGTGTLLRGGVPLLPGQQVTASEIAAGLFTYRGPQDGHGSALAAFAFQLQDTGNGENGGANISAVETATINVAPVNDPPTFLGGPDLIANDTDRAGISMPNWARMISTGPANEAGQSLAPPGGFQVTADNPSLFSVQPAVDPATGALTFTPAPNVHGTATVTVRLRDDGGTANGGADTSGVYTFRITINKPMRMHNTARPLDVTDGSGNGPPDGFVAPGDALRIINHINLNGSGPVGATTFGPPYLDTVNSQGQFTGDNFVAPGDALAVINWINANGSSTPGPEGEFAGWLGGEGESPADSFFLDLGTQAMGAASTRSASETRGESPQASGDSLSDMIALLAADAASQADRRRRRAF
jgi:hypothetical protein